MLLTIVFILLAVSTILSIILSTIDGRKKRALPAEKPFISFIIPSYNDANTLLGTIESINNSYPKEKSEILIINDCSKDNTCDILKEIENKFENCRGETNSENIGKSASINKTFPKTKGEIIFMVDSDINLSENAINDILSRFRDEKVGGVSCRYKVKNKGFLPAMQELEYNMLGFTQSSYNLTSTVSMWGGCMAFKRQAFLDIGMLRTNFLSEDMDSALKLKEHGWRCEQSNEYVLTSAPEKIGSWFRQKKRWSAGFIQNFIAHRRVFLKNPLAVTFYLAYSASAVLFLIALISKTLLIGHWANLFLELREVGYPLSQSIPYAIYFYSSVIMQKLLVLLAYPLFSIPYIIYDTHWKLSWKYLLIIPYALIYYPMYMIMNLIGFGVGIAKYKKLKTGVRAW